MRPSDYQFAGSSVEKMDFVIVELNPDSLAESCGEIGGCQNLQNRLSNPHVVNDARSKRFDQEDFTLEGVRRTSRGAESQVLRSRREKQFLGRRLLSDGSRQRF